MALEAWPLGAAQLLTRRGGKLVRDHLLSAVNACRSRVLFHDLMVLQLTQEIIQRSSVGADGDWKWLTAGSHCRRLVLSKARTVEGSPSDAEQQQQSAPICDSKYD